MGRSSDNKQICLQGDGDRRGTWAVGGHGPQGDMGEVRESWTRERDRSLRGNGLKVQ